jgi:hypothetical protein
MRWLRVRVSHPLDLLERGVLDDSVSLATLLRQVVVIGGRASSPELRAWATQELKGYTDSEVELPGYRMIYAPLKIDGRSPAWEVKGQTITVLDLPDFARRHISEEAPVPFGVGKIEAMIARADPDEPIKLGHFKAADLASHMTYERQDRGIVVDNVYWAVHITALQDILDQVRTRLAEFVAELRSTMPTGEHEPTPAQVQRAVQNINITTGDNSPVNLAAPLAYAEQDATASASSGDRQRQHWWRRR